MMLLDPISTAYGMVVGTVLTAIVIIGAIYWEEMYGKQQIEGSKVRKGTGKEVK